MSAVGSWSGSDWLQSDSCRIVVSTARGTGNPTVPSASHTTERFPTEPRKLRVFLCHATDDKPTVRALYLWLQNNGFQPWLDEEYLLPGQEWQQEIRKAVHTSDTLLVCLSRRSITKEGYVQKEIKLAADVASGVTQKRPMGVTLEGGGGETGRYYLPHSSQTGGVLGSRSVRTPAVCRPI
jgi:hypothetical protein